MLLLLSLFTTLPLTAQLDWVATHPGTIVYSLDLSDVRQHELHVTVDFPAVKPGVFTVRMPQASPGRYAVHNFAKNVYDLKAYDGAGKQLHLSQEEPTAWAIAGHDGSVRLEYTLFANGGDGTYAGVDDRKLHLNMPAAFLYGEQLNDRPVLLGIRKGQRPDWMVASQLVPVTPAAASEPRTRARALDRLRAAPNYYYFYDSPTLVGEMMRGEFAVTNPDGNTQTIEMAMMHEGTREQFDDYLAWTESIVLTQQKIYGELPDFDYGRYTFLCSYNPWIGGDGMEHRNSTVCSAPVGLEQFADRLIGTVSHEFFHCWNVERIRPASLEPFDFDHANMSGELWFAEGFTSYYDDLTLVRAGILSPEDYARNLKGQLNYVLLSPGRDHRGPVQMSQQAPFVDAATANDPDNFGNTFVSYYPYGATIGLALDLTLRERGHTLDELMRLVWERYGRTEIPYHIRDLQLALGEVVDDQEWAAAWFERYVYGSALPDLGALLDDYGFVLRTARPDSVGFRGLRLSEGDGFVTVESNIPENSPLHATGLQRGDRILGIHGWSATSPEAWEEAIARQELGQEISITFVHLGREIVDTFVTVADPTLEIEVRELKGKARKRRTSWLGKTE